MDETVITGQGPKSFDDIRGIKTKTDQFTFTNGKLDVNATVSGNAGGTSSVDDGAFTVATDSGTPMMGVVTSDSVDAGDVGVVGMLANRQLKTTLYDSGGAEITSFGGGTQYTEGDTDASITGTALLWEDGSDTLRAVSAAKPLPVDIQDTTIAVTQSGTWDEVGINDSGNSITVDDGGTTLSVDDGGTTISIDDGASSITVDGTVAVTGVSTLAEQQSQTTHLATIAGDTTDIETAVELIDDAIVADDAAFTPAVTKVMMAGFEFDDTTPDSVNEGDAGAARMSANRNVYTQIRDAAGNERGLNVDANGEIQISGSRNAIAVTNAGLTELAAAIDTELQVDVVGALPAGSNNIGDVDVLSIAAGDNNIGNVDVVTLPALPAGTNNIGDVDIFSNTAKDGSGTRYQPLVDTDGHLQVDVLSGGGAGTQYTEGDTDASITGTAMLWEDGSDTLRAVSAAKPLPVDLQDSTVAVTQSGNWTVRLSDGTDTADVLDLTNSNPLTVAIVDGSGDQITSFGGGTQYTEDAAAAANPVGTALMLVREDARAGSLTNTDGDNVAARGNNKGELYVKSTDSDALLTTIDADTGNISTKIDTLAGAVSGTEFQVDVLTSALPSGAATSAKQDTQITAQQAIQTSVELIDDAIKADDAAFTPATTKVMMAGFEYDDTTPDSVDEGDAGAARMSANRNVYMQIRDAAGNERGANVNASGQLSVTGPVTNAGTFAVQVDGSALTALQLIDDPVATLGTTTYSEATTKGMIMGAVRRDADTTLVDTTNEVSPLQVDANGRLKVEAFSGETLPVSLTSTTVTGTVAVTQSGTWDEVGINDSGNSITVDNGGTFAVQVDGAALTALQLIDDGVYTDDTSTHSTGSSKGYGFMAVATPTDASVNANDFGHVGMTTDRKLHVAVMDALPAGTAAIGKLAANSGVDIGDVDVTSIAAGTNVIGDVGLAPRTSGGLSIHRSIDLDESEEEVKATAGQVYGIWFTNTATTTRWLKLYNDTAANVSVGTTTPVITIGLPGNTSDDISGALFNGGLGIPFSSAICAAATTGVADNDTGAPGANEVIVNIFYK